MEPNETLAKIDAYIRVKLTELVRGARGKQKEVADTLGLSSAHISNMISDPPSRNPSEEVRRGVAKLLGMSYAELEAAALGRSAAEPVRIVESDHRYEALDRVGRKLGFERAVVDRAQENYGRHGLQEMSDELAKDLLAIAKRSLDDEQRAFELDGFRRGSKVIERVIADDEDDIGAQPKKIARR